MVASSAAVHPVAAVEAALEALSDADDARSDGSTGGPFRVQSTGSLVQCERTPYESGLSEKLL